MANMTQAEREMIASGFVRCPNWRDRWYAGGPGIMEPSHPLEIRMVAGEQIEIVARPYGKFQASDAVALLKFADVADLLAYLARHGVLSQPGLPAFLHGD